MRSHVDAASMASSGSSSLWARRPASDGRLTVLVLFLPPALLLFTLFVVLPIGEAAWYSAFNWNGFGRPTHWVGFDNYRLVLATRAFWRTAALAAMLKAKADLPMEGLAARTTRSERWSPPSSRSSSMKPDWNWKAIQRTKKLSGECAVRCTR